MAVADLDGARARRLAEQHDARSYTDAAAMLVEMRPDVACVCTPSGLHGEHAILAMRAGCHVVVEKPMAIAREALDRMRAAQRETGAPWR